MHRNVRSVALLLVALGVVACDEVGSPLSIDSTGELTVQAFLDRNGSGELDAGVDLPAVGLRVALLRTSGDTVATQVTNAAGVARFQSLTLGTYRVGVSAVALGDSLRLVRPDSGRVSVRANEPAEFELAIGYPRVTARQIAALPAGRLVTATGVALHSYNAFGDSLVHVRDSTGFLRVSGPPETITAATGDSVRITGRVGVRLGRPALVTASVFRIASAQTPQPRAVSTAVAASAESGALDGALLSIANARVISVTNLPQGEFRVRVTDGSGALDVFLDRDAAITTEDPVVPGVLLEVTGILMPREGSPGEWMLKPRASLDLRVTVPRVTTTEARAMVAGSLVEIRAVALNGVATFGDNTVHIVDPSGALRAINVNASFQFAGDSIRARGVLAIREGQMVLTQTTLVVLGKSTVPPPTHIATEVAARANGGVLDAALVEVRNAEVKSLSAFPGQDVFLTVDDGTGVLTVILDRDTGIGTAGLTVGSKANFVGLLVPTASGTWQLKPRSPADVVKQ
ncbi:MAG: hypothetical protein H0U67_01895 [Gemmatimonadetes bacterium]|nr:hypothetical protein [Gemmatimonadota bacterium]MBA3892066.1 hypothetical protein [Gemmatimonadaceae bacterium]